MSITQVLRLGRALGLENFSQLKPLVRQVQSGKPFTQNLNLVFKGGYQDEFVKIADEALKAKCKDAPVNLNEILALSKKSFPIANAKDNKTLVNLNVTRYGDKSGSISANASTINTSGDVVASGESKILGNSSGLMARAKVSCPEQNYSYDLELATTKDSAPNLFDIVSDETRMKIKNGLFTMTIPETEIGKATLSANMKVNESYMDEVCKLTGLENAKEMVKINKEYKDGTLFNKIANSVDFDAAAKKAVENFKS